MRPAYAPQLTAAVAVQVYVVASWHSWWQGDAFGARMLISRAPVFALGLAALATWARSRVSLRPVLLVAVLAVLWNALFVVQYKEGLIPQATPASWQQLTVGKITMLPRLAQALHRFIEWTLSGHT